MRKIDTNHEDTKNTENGIEMLTRSESASGRALAPYPKSGLARTVFTLSGFVRLKRKQRQQTYRKDRSIIFRHIQILLISYKPRSPVTIADVFRPLVRRRAKDTTGGSGGFTHWQFRYSAGALRRFLSDVGATGRMSMNAHTVSEHQNRFSWERNYAR